MGPDVIRLGSLAGYPFEGPRLLAGWTPPKTAAVFSVLYRPEPERKPEQYGVIYVGHADDLSQAGFPFAHEAAPCWLQRADRYALHIAYYEVPGGTASHREVITRELIAVYRPGCNPDQYDQAWKDTWIQEYKAPTAGPLTTERQPGK